jgi:hypothetical protein
MIQAVIGRLLISYQNEQWSQGCPCPVMGPGGLTQFEHVLRAPSGRVHFVGKFSWAEYHPRHLLITPNYLQAQKLRTNGKATWKEL